MDTARRVLGILLAISLPPALIYWFVVHPFIAFWRKLGTMTTYIIVASGFVGMAAWLYTVRDGVLSTDYGTNWWLVALGAILYLYSAWIRIRMRKYLSFRTLAGVPEVANERQNLITNGIFGEVRHPRYLSVVVGITGFALVINYLGIYLLTALMYPAIYFVILLEERELVERFGEAYREYQQRVPQIIPRHRG